MSLFSDELKRRVNDYFPALGDRPPGMGSGGLLGLIESVLSSVDSGKGASQVGVENADGVLVAATDVEAAITEVGTAQVGATLTVNAEDTNVIAIDFVSPVPSVETYMAEVFDTTGQANAAAFTLAETGGGAEVSATGKGRLIFSTAAGGDAQISVTDVAGGSGKTVIVVFTPLSASGDVAVRCAPTYTTVTFD